MSDTEEFDEIQPHYRNLGIALSGGGVRASAYSLGCLLFLVDSGLNRRVTVVSSVSGGSITNGFVAQEVDSFDTTQADTFDRVAADFLHRLQHKPVLSGFLTKVLGAFFLGGLGFAIALAFGWPTDLHPVARVLILLFAGALISLRGWPIEWNLRRRYFSVDRRPVVLDSLGFGRTAHVFCSTDLMNACPHFFVAWRGGHTLARAGWQRATNVNLATAVRASAALPGAFPPRIHSGTALTDGGVWNNLATQWFTERLVDKGWDESDVQDRPADQLPGSGFDEKSGFAGNILVANASGVLAPIERGSRWKFKVPFLNEAVALGRVTSTIYGNTVEPRKDAAYIWLLTQITNTKVFDLEGTPNVAVATMGDYSAEFELPGLLRNSSTRLEYDYMKETFLELADQVEAFENDLAAVTVDGHTLDAVFRKNREAPTTLQALTRDEALSLVIEGYIRSARAATYLVAASRDLPGRFTLRWPGIDRFTKLFNDGSPP